jgi:hypothetical protein
MGAAGLLDLPKDPIEYSERSPLVVPPSATLPPPSGIGDAAKLNPEWPDDPDWKLIREGKKRTTVAPEEARGNFYPWGSNVKVEDMSRVNPAKPEKKAADASGGYATAGEEAGAGADRYSPSQLGFKGWGKKDSVSSFTSEPERSMLTEPPAGYRTPSPNAPYGVVEDKSKYSKSSPFDRLDDPNRVH